jgi:IS5 family transposase
MFKKHTPDTQQSFFFNLADTLDHRHPLFILAGKIGWGAFEAAFSKHYHPTHGRPCMPIRLMAGLLILKHVRNLSDESVVEQWSENLYYQHFCGELEFRPGAPCEASELVHFRKRIGVEGVELIFKESIRVNGKDGGEGDVVVDTTVQEKNITFPTDAKLQGKIIAKCRELAEEEGVELRQSYRRTEKRLRAQRRFAARSKEGRKRGRAAGAQIKRIAGRLVRELMRKLPAQHRAQEDLAFYGKVLGQKRGDTDKVYSLHEREVCCIAKGKEHRKYEFGNKVAIAYTRTSGVIVSVTSHRNPYDGHTLERTLGQHERLTGKRAGKAIGDRGFRWRKRVGETRIAVPGNGAETKAKTPYQKSVARKDFRRRAAIEPVIGHLKSDHRLGRNFLKGVLGDELNAMLAAAAFNFKRMLNKWKRLLPFLLRCLFFHHCPYTAAFTSKPAFPFFKGRLVSRS